MSYDILLVDDEEGLRKVLALSLKDRGYGVYGAGDGQQALALFERGIGLVGVCTRKLDEAEKKVEVLVKNQEGILESRPFDERAEV